MGVNKCTFMVKFREILSNLVKNKFINNTGWIVGERIYQMVINLLLTIITARYLGPSNYGILNYVASIIAFFTSLCTLGLQGVIVKELVQEPKEEGVLLGSGIGMRLISSFLSMLVALIIISILNPNDNLILVVALLQSISLLFRSFELIEFWYQSKLKSRYSSIIKAIAYTIMAIYKILILLLDKDVTWFAFSNTIDAIVIAILFYVSYNKSGGLKISFSINTAKKLLNQSYHFILSGAIVAIYEQMSKVMIGQFLGQEQVGYYSVAITICGLWTFIPQAFITSATPIIMELKKSDEHIYLHRLKQLYAFIAWLGIAFALTITFFSKWIVLVLYGDAYIVAIPALVIAVWYTLFSSLGSARGIWILCENKNKFVKKYLFWGAVVNLTLNAIMIPQYGIEGAALATLTTQVFTTLIAPLLYKETRMHTKYVIEAFILKGLK